MGLLGQPFVPFLSRRESDALSFGQRDVGLRSLSDYEDIVKPGGETMSLGVLDVNDVKATRMSLARGDDTNTPQVVAACHHAEVPGFEFDEVQDLAVSDVQPDSVVDLNQGVGVADGAAVVRHEEGHALRPGSHFLDAAQLVLGLLGGDLVEDEPALHVVQETEKVTCLLDGDHVHEPRGVRVVSSNPAIDFNSPLHDDLGHLAVGQSILQPVPEDDDEGQGLPQLVGASRGSGREDPSQLVQNPCLGGREALQMLLRSSSLQRYGNSEKRHGVRHG